MLAHGEFLLSTFALISLFGGAGIACFLAAFTAAALNTKCARRKAGLLSITGFVCFILALFSAAIAQALYRR